MSAMEIIKARERRITVLQGTAEVSDVSGIVLTTVLGSCVAACLYDPVARLGGMNHFLLAEPGATGLNGADEAYGVYLMEILINAMLVRGAQRSRLRARLYGGANFNPAMAFVGQANAAFAQDFMAREGIECLVADLGGRAARRVEFAPSSGRVRSLVVDARAVPPPVRAQTRARNDVELF
ncbi:chemotaxis protein CheD [Sandarakinorhabdus sp.]|uniref:chemotaxis protein CheD n=1 Tax=Sandarakinorhabdus sp. TaxID=1916663 RepID=UPI00334210F6